MVDLSALALFTGTPFINIYFRLMGAKIGKGVYLGSPLIRVFDLTKIGDNSSFSKEANLIGYKVENGTLIIGKINVGENCYVGARSVVSPNSEMEDFSSLGELSLLPSNTTIPKNEYWKGSPAAKIIINENIKVSVNKKRNKNIPYPIYFIIQFLATTFVTTFPFLLIIPFLALFHEIEINFGFEWSLISLIPSTGIYIISFCLIIALFKWIIVGKVKEEDFGIYSIRYIQKWIVDNLINMSLLYFRSVYATIYLPSWLRLLGAKIGKASEISTVNQLNTDLLEIGDGSFLADSVSIGAPVVKNKIMSLKKISIGEKTFIGNSAVVSYGNKIGNNSLIGVLSVPPFKKEDALRNDSSWLGSPSMFLPQRQQSEPFPDKLKFHPTKDLYIKRGAIEIVKITLPYIISSMLVVIFYSILPIDLFNQNWILFGIVSTLLLFLLMLITPVITYIFKKMLINKYRPVNKPLWSLFVWKNELINSLCENMVYPLLVSTLLGTPFAPIFFRMMGCKIGKKVFMETTEITEFDMVSIGDEVSLNYLATIQTHLFEDRVMKISHLNIGNNCNIGSMSVVLYDSVMEENSSIDALTLVMKGEIIPAKSRWAGSPAKFVKAL
jgi:non-ribosomal peptide synthetase-like protein